MPGRILIAMFCLMAAAWPQAPIAERPAPGEVLTLEQAVRLALGNNRLVEIASQDVKKSEDSVAAARTHFFPQTKLSIFGSQLLTDIHFTVDPGQFGTFPGIGPVPATKTFITTPQRFNAFMVGQVSQPVSQLYKIQLGLRQGQMAAELSRQKLRAQQQSVSNEVKRAYLAALDAEGQLQVAEADLKFCRELERVVGNYLEEKAALKSDSLDAKARLAKAEYDALTAGHALATRKEQLNRLLGRDIRTEFTLSPVSEPSALETDLAAAQSRALEQNPSVQEARLRVKLAEQGRRIKKAEYIPDVGLTFNYISPFGIEFVPKNIAAFGVQFSWEPLDWGRRKHEVDEESRIVAQARSALQEAEQGALLDVNDKLRKLEEARALVRVAAMARDAAEEKVRVAQARHAEHSILFKDLLQSQSNFAAAAHSYYEAVLGFWAARADFEKAVGETQ